MSTLVMKMKKRKGLCFVVINNVLSVNEWRDTNYEYNCFGGKNIPTDRFKICDWKLQFVKWKKKKKKVVTYHEFTCRRNWMKD